MKAIFDNAFLECNYIITKLAEQEKDGKLTKKFQQNNPINIIFSEQYIQYDNTQFQNNYQFILNHIFKNDYFILSSQHLIYDLFQKKYILKLIYDYTYESLFIQRACVIQTYFTEYQLNEDFMKELNLAADTIQYFNYIIHDPIQIILLKCGFKLQLTIQFQQNILLVNSLDQIVDEAFIKNVDIYKKIKENLNLMAQQKYHFQRKQKELQFKEINDNQTNRGSGMTCSIVTTTQENSEESEYVLINDEKKI